MSERGKYIVIEGSDGTGKSTQVEILQRHLGDIGISSIQIHEPDGFVGDSELGIPAVTGATELRRIIKNGSIERDGWSNLQLFTAARRLNWLQAMQPALDSNVWVLAARSWISTVAYQGYGEGIDPALIRQRTMEDVGESYLSPDLELILTLDDERTRFERIESRTQPENPDTFESKSEEFQDAMQNGYLQFAKDYGVKTIDASQSVKDVENIIWQQVEPLTRSDYETVS